MTRQVGPAVAGPGDAGWCGRRVDRQAFDVAGITTVALSDHPDTVEAARALLEEYMRLPDVWERFGGVPARFPEPFEREIRTFPGGAVPPGGEVIVGVSETGELVGVGQVVGFEGEVCEFKRVFVRPEHRRKGVGVQVAQAMAVRARELGYRRVVLDVVPERTAAIALWIGLGFRSCPPYRQYPCPMEFMAMDLDGRAT